MFLLQKLRQLYSTLKSADFWRTLYCIKFAQATTTVTVIEADAMSQRALCSALSKNRGWIHSLRDRFIRVTVAAIVVATAARIGCRTIAC